MTDGSWLFFLSDAAPEKLRSAGLAILATGRGRWHAGMLHRAADEAVRMLDLANDHWLRDSPPSSKVAWVQLALPSARLLSVAAMCRRIAKLYASPGGGLPYAFRYRETGFRADGRMLLGKSEHGLTCATFVLAVLKSVRVDLLKLADWPHREEDAARHRELLAMLRADPRIARAHVDAVADEINCIRYRPEEVVGAASRAELPVSFIDAVAAAEQIKRAFALRGAGPAT